MKFGGVKGFMLSFGDFDMGVLEVCYDVGDG